MLLNPVDIGIAALAALVAPPGDDVETAGTETEAAEAMIRPQYWDTHAASPLIHETRRHSAADEAVWAAVWQMCKPGRRSDSEHKADRRQSDSRVCARGIGHMDADVWTGRVLLTYLVKFGLPSKTGKECVRHSMDLIVDGGS